MQRDSMQAILGGASGRVGLLSAIISEPSYPEGSSIGGSLVSCLVPSIAAVSSVSPLACQSLARSMDALFLD
jgi:hypothetical protein